MHILAIIFLVMIIGLVVFRFRFSTNSEQFFSIVQLIIGWLCILVGLVFSFTAKLLIGIPMLVLGTLIVYGDYRQKKHIGYLDGLETKLLKAKVKSDGSNIDAKILSGGYEGRYISSLSLEVLLSIYNSCRSANDVSSMKILEAYFDKNYPDWRLSGNNHKSSDSGMSIAEARMILGVGVDATEAEIIQAHKKLIKKNHPDHGGSDYLAQKINQAKKVLLS